MNKNSSTDSSKSIYVGNIDPRVTKEQLYEIFIQFGIVNKIRYPKDKISQDYQGYAFIEFSNENDLNYILKLANAKNSNNGNIIRLYDRWLRIRRTGDNNNNNNSSNTKNDKSNENINDIPLAKIIIENLDNTIDLKTITRIVTKFGKIYKPVEFFSNNNDDDEEGANLNTVQNCYIYFNYYRDADNAIKTLNGTHIGNQNVIVKYAKRSQGQKGYYGSKIDRLMNNEAEKHGLL